MPDRIVKSEETNVIETVMRGPPILRRWDTRAFFESIMKENPEFEPSDRNEILEKNSALVQYRYVDTKKVILSILESGKSKEEMVDLLAELVEPSPDKDALSQNKVDFDTAAKVDPGSLAEKPIRYEDRKLHPNYANMNAVEFLRAVWGNAEHIKQLHLRLHDPKLIAAVHSACQLDAKRPPELRLGYVASNILPPSSRSYGDEAKPLNPGTIEYVRAYDRARKASRVIDL
jgi:hypothetical protein